MTEAALQRTFITPEGVDLQLWLGSAGQRASAFLLDLGCMLGTLIGFTIIVALIAWATSGNGIGTIGAIWLIGFFLLRNAWFTLFEMGTKAATPGKRIMGLRVVARDGGRLTGDAIIARNAMREIEFFLPLSFLGYETALGAAGAWTAIFGLTWSGVFLFFPLFNRDRLRVGDLFAGTWVICTPKRALGSDLITENEAGVGLYNFSTKQLEAYGIYELQTLEDVLRRSDWEQMQIVSNSIRDRIGWRRGADDAAFLMAYYAALRGHLERDLLFGKRRADKHGENRAS